MGESVKLKADKALQLALEARLALEYERGRSDAIAAAKRVRKWFDCKPQEQAKKWADREIKKMEHDSKTI